MSDSKSPAVALWEFASIVEGVNAADAIAKGAPIDLIFPKEGLDWDLEAFAIHAGTKKLDAAKKLADWASSKDAMKLYGKNFAYQTHYGGTPLSGRYGFDDSVAEEDQPYLILIACS